MALQMILDISYLLLGLSFGLSESLAMELMTLWKEFFLEISSMSGIGLPWDIMLEVIDWHLYALASSVMLFFELFTNRPCILFLLTARSLRISYLRSDTGYLMVFQLRFFFFSKYRSSFSFRCDRVSFPIFGSSSSVESGRSACGHRIVPCRGLCSQYSCI